MSGTATRLRWKLRRLEAMDPAEVLHRVREAAKRAVWRRDLRGWDAFAEAEGAALVIPEALGRRMAPPESPALRAAAGASVEMVRARAFRFLGHAWPAAGPEAPIDWLLDPVSGQRWEGAEKYCFDVDHRHAPGRGDVKLVWELNRLGFLPWLAWQADPPPAVHPWRVLASWMEANPPFRGVNWNSGIELALRVVAVTLAMAAWRPPLLEEERAMIARFLAAHAFWLARYPSLYSSANNHLLSEGLGLFVAGTVAPGLPEAPRWAAEGRAILEREAVLQFSADGVGAEQSPTYTAFSAEMLALAALVARDAGRPLAPQVQSGLAATAGWLRAMMDRRGALPRIGDDDEGRVLAAPPDREPRYVASVVAALAGLTGRPELAPPERDPHPRDALFGSPEGPGALPAGVSVFPRGGYSAVRERAGGREILVVFDHGPLGYLSIAAHGHADTLAFWLHLDGRPVIVDAGTWLYHAAGPWRGAFCGTRAHNTLRLGGEDSSIQTGAFLWSHKARGALRSWAGGERWSLTGAHDGYLSRFGLTHVRTLRREGERLLVLDQLEGEGPAREATLSLLFHPELEIVPVEGGFRALRDGAPVLEIAGDPTLTPTLVRGDEQGRQGWYSPAFGERQPATQIVWSGTLGPGARVVTTLRPL